MLPRVRELQVLAESRERPGAGLRPIQAGWSPIDYKDSIVIRAVISPGTRASGSVAGLLVADVEAQVAPMVWEDSTHETLDYDRMKRAAFWTPAVIATRTPVPGGGRASNAPLLVDIGVVRPDQLAAQLAKYDGRLAVLSFRVKAFSSAERQDIR